MTQLSTTAVSRFQFRNRVSFQEYSSLTHKSDFLSKMFLDFCQTEIPGSLQRWLRYPDYAQMSVMWTRFARESWGFYSRGSGCLGREARSSTQQLPALCSSTSPVSQMQHRNSDCRLVENNFLNQSKCDILILSHAWVFWANACLTQWLMDRDAK